MSLKKYYLLLLLLISQASFAQDKEDTLAAWTQYQKADQLYKAKDYTNSNIYFQQAADIYAKSQLMARVLNCHNRSLVNLIFLKEVPSKIEACIQFIRKDLHSKTIDIENQAYTYFIAGYYYFALIGNYELAAYHYKTALSLYKQTDNHSRIVQTLRNLGIIYTDLTLYSESIKIYQQVINLLAQKQDIFLLAQTYNTLGVSYLMNKEYAEAEIAFKKSESLFQKAPVSNQIDFNKHHRTLLYNFGILYEETRNHIKSLKYYQKTLEIAMLSKDSLFIADIYNALGGLYNNQKNYDKALVHYKKAITFVKQEQTYQRSNYKRLLGNIAKTYFKKEEYDVAKYYNQKLFQQLKPNTGNIREDYTNYCLIKSHLLRIEQKDDSAYFYIQQAAEYNTQRIANTEHFYDPVLQLNILNQKAEILGKINPESALNQYLLCDNLIQEILKQYHYQSNQIAFVNLSDQVYHSAMLFSIRELERTKNNEWKDWVFFFSEKKKAQILQIQREKLRLNKLLNIPSEILAQEQEIQRRIAYLNTKLNTDSKQQSQYIDSLLYYNELYQNFLTETERDYPQFYEMRYARNISDLSTLQKSLRDDEVIISYSIGYGENIILVINSEDLFIQKLDFTEEALTLKAEDFRVSILEMEDADSYKLGKELYQILISPIQKFLNNKKRIQIITEDVLQILPFDALVTSNGKFFLEEKIIINHLSASLVYKTKQKEYYRSNSFLGFAPGFLNVQDIANLPNSITEIEAIAKAFQNKGYKSSIFTTQDASKSNFLNLREKYSSIHLSTHSTFYKNAPSKSKILFHPNRTDESNHLYLNEIYGLDIKANLLVLSSCESGLGELKVGEGILSLGRAFLYIGIPNIVYSLWKIDENLSQEFMLYFYKEILEGKSYAVAINSAKVKVLQKKGYRSPLWWSGFTMVSVYK